MSWKGIKNHTVYKFLVSVAIVIFKHHIFKNFNLYNRHLLITIIYFASANICTYYGMFGKIFKNSLFFFTKTVIRIGFHILTNYRQRLFQFYAGENCLTIIEFESWRIFFFSEMDLAKPPKLEFSGQYCINIFRIILLLLTITNIKIVVNVINLHISNHYAPLFSYRYYYLNFPSLSLKWQT